MADYKKMLICWNVVQYANKIKSHFEDLGFSVRLCTDFQSLADELADVNGWKADYMIVLCELTWSNNVENAPYSEMKGIKLVQYLRREKDIKIPILFVSFLGRKNILDKHAWAQIIRTPILKHGFFRLPSHPGEWSKILEETLITDKYKKKANDEDPDHKDHSPYNCTDREMSELELAYTKQYYCGIDGLIKQIYHPINSCSKKDEFLEQLKVLKSAIENKYFEFANSINDLETLLTDDTINPNIIRKMFHTICGKIMYGSGKFIR